MVAPYPVPPLPPAWPEELASMPTALELIAKPAPGEVTVIVTPGVDEPLSPSLLGMPPKESELPLAAPGAMTSDAPATLLLGWTLPVSALAPLPPTARDGRPNWRVRRRWERSPDCRCNWWFPSRCSCNCRRAPRSEARAPRLSQGRGEEKSQTSRGRRRRETAAQGRTASAASTRGRADWFGSMTIQPLHLLHAERHRPGANAQSHGAALAWSRFAGAWPEFVGSSAMGSFTQSLMAPCRTVNREPEQAKL